MQFQINKDILRRHFNRHAHEYDQYAQVQADLGRILSQKLSNELTRSRHPIRSILEIGCGTGNLTCELRKLYPTVQYTAVDLSSSMIEVTRNKLGTSAGFDRTAGLGTTEKAGTTAGLSNDCITFLALDAESSELHDGFKPFDVIISNAAFQWFNQTEATIHSLVKKLLNPGGILAFTTFGPNTFHELHSSFEAAESLLGIKKKMHGQAFFSGDQWNGYLAGAGLDNRIDWEEEIREIDYSSVYDFLNSVKRIGAGNATETAIGSKDVGSSKAVFSAMEQYYRKRYPARTGQGIRATYHQCCGILVKAVSPNADNS